MRDVVIVQALRSPIGKRDGKLSVTRPVHLAARILQALVSRADLDPNHVQDVILGCVTPLGEQGANIARLAVLQAGFPVHVPAVTINRMCGSSQQAVHFAAQEILSGDMDVVIAGGIEMMSRVPIGSDWPKQWPPDFPYALVHQGLSAEMMAEKWKLGREELDRFSFASHVKAAAATRRARASRASCRLSAPGATRRSTRASSPATASARGPGASAGAWPASRAPACTRTAPRSRRSASARRCGRTRPPR